LELAIALAGNNGRLLFVGDPRQAIMGFAGADCNSYQNILERTQSIELPLSICYRCPKSHIELVKKNFPEIPMIARANAIEGKIEAIAEGDLWSDKPCRLTTGDMVLCRKTAPLVKLCIKLITKGIAATVKGRAIGELIKGDLQEIAKIPGFRYSQFNDAVSAYRAEKQQRYEGLDNEEQLCKNLKDKLEALTEIYKSQPQATCIPHLENYIDSLFSDETSLITLSTCHRAKGLEGDRIFIINPHDLPMVWRNQQDWQLEQEYNLLYVALTRSKSELYVVGNASWLQAEADPKPEPEPEIKEETVNHLQQPNSKEKLKNWLEGLHEKVRAALLSPLGG
jgi:ATP-dependent exoDNAse (exonuclease V) beta subunit